MVTYGTDLYIHSPHHSRNGSSIGKIGYGCSLIVIASCNHNGVRIFHSGSADIAYHLSHTGILSLSGTGIFCNISVKVVKKKNIDLVCRGLCLNSCILTAYIMGFGFTSCKGGTQDENDHNKANGFKKFAVLHKHTPIKAFNNLIVKLYTDTRKITSFLCTLPRIFRLWVYRF